MPLGCLASLYGTVEEACDASPSPPSASPPSPVSLPPMFRTSTALTVAGPCNVLEVSNVSSIAELLELTDSPEPIILRGLLDGRSAVGAEGTARLLNEWAALPVISAIGSATMGQLGPEMQSGGDYRCGAHCLNQLCECAQSAGGVRTRDTTKLLQPAH